MRWLTTLCVCSIVAFVLAGAVASAETTVPTWLECGSAAKASGQYTSRTCRAASKVSSGGRYELRQGVRKGRRFKGTSGRTVLHVRTMLGNDTIECASSSDSGTPELPNLETGVNLSYKHCVALGSKVCATSGDEPGEVQIEGLRGELGFVEESPKPVVGLRLESEAHPGTEGELASFNCEGLEVTLTGGLIGVQEKDVNVVSRKSKTVFSSAERIGEQAYEGTKYKPLVNLVGWAREQAEIAEEIGESERGEVGKLARPILKTTMCSGGCEAQAYAGQDQTLANKGEALMISTNPGAVEGGEGGKVMLIGEIVPHEHGGDAKAEEIGPLPWVAKKSGTVEEICLETSSYVLQPAETSLVLGIQEVGARGLPGKVLAEETYHGTLGTNDIARVKGLKVPIVKGKTYYLSFDALGGAITYWFGLADTIIYSEHHKKLEEGPPEDFVWLEEAEEAPIGIWGMGTPH